MNTNVTKHAVKKMKERNGLPKKSSKRIAQKALEFGIKHSDSRGKLRKYMDGLFLRHKNANNNRIYNDSVYIFQGDLLITSFHLDSSLIPLARKIQKQLKEKENE
ncbi:hypothetical protein KLEB273_gp079 [Bacillus phage vB_BauM_KLEB27-3]|nr:hypothetical protein KLEB273_gp079 [Bacillus phage vB_BauM_KLEB27-3]